MLLPGIPPDGQHELLHVAGEPGWARDTQPGGQELTGIGAGPLVAHPQLLQIRTNGGADSRAFGDSRGCCFSVKCCCAGTPPTS